MLKIGRIYVLKQNGMLYRIFKSGGGGWYSGRGCTKRTASPNNYIKFDDVREPSIEQINFFLEEEMTNGMCQTFNKPRRTEITSDGKIFY